LNRTKAGKNKEGPFPIELVRELAIKQAGKETSYSNCIGTSNWTSNLL